MLTLLLFGWQTWEFVNFLFPDDQLLMKILTLFSFDIMSLIWGCTHRFYNFAHPQAKVAAAWGFWVTTFLSFVATIIYMVIQSMFRFHVLVGADIVNMGYGVTIGALVLNILLLATFLYQEIGVRSPNYDEFVEVDEVLPNNRTIDASPTRQLRLPVAPARPRTAPLARKTTPIPHRTHAIGVYESEEDSVEENDIDEDEELIVGGQPLQYATGPLTRQQQQPLQQANTPTPQSQTTINSAAQKMSSHPVQHLQEADAATFQPALSIPIPIQRYQHTSRQGMNGQHGQQTTPPSSSTLVPDVQRIPTSQPLPRSSQPLQEAAPIIQETRTPKSEQFSFPVVPETNDN